MCRGTMQQQMSQVCNQDISLTSISHVLVSMKSCVMENVSADLNHVMENVNLMQKVDTITQYFVRKKIFAKEKQIHVVENV